MPTYIPGYSALRHHEPFVPVFPKESLPATPAHGRGITYLKAILETLGQEVTLPDNAPRLCVKEKGVLRLRPLRTIANDYCSFAVTFADNGETTRLFSFNLADKEVSMLSDFILGHFNPDPHKVEYNYIRTINASFIIEHGELDAGDWEKIFNAQKLMATLRISPAAHRNPLPGDTLQGAYYNGKHPFTRGVILQRPRWAQQDDTKINFCAEPYTPYITGTGSLDTSGGPFFSADKRLLRFLGEEERLFWCFGHDGACGNGGIHFPCRSNRWSLDDGWED